MAKLKTKPDLRFAEFDGEWREQKIGEIAEISSASRVHKNEWTDSGVPFFRSSDVVSAFKGTENQKAFISYSLFEALAKRSGKVQKGDVLITGGGSVGVPYLIKDNSPLYFKDADLIWIKKTKNLHGKFLFAYFTAPYFRSYVLSISHVGTISHYTIEQVKDTPILLPKINEQKKLGALFKNLDTLITLHQRKYDKTISIKKAMLDKMFPREGESKPEIRFAEFTGAWEQRSLEELVDFSKGRGYTKGDLKESGTPIILYGRLYTKYETEIYGVDTFVLEKENSVFSKGNEILVPASGETAEDISRAAVVKTAGIILGGDLNILKPKADIEPTFLAITISNGIHQKELSRRAQGKSVVHIHNSDLQMIVLTLPKLEEQRKISTVFRNLDNLLSLHQRELTKLKNIKKALLEKMFV